MRKIRIFEHVSLDGVIQVFPAVRAKTATSHTSRLLRKGGLLRQRDETVHRIGSGSDSPQADDCGRRAFDRSDRQLSVTKCPNSLVCRS